MTFKPPFASRRETGVVLFQNLSGGGVSALGLRISPDVQCVVHDNAVCSSGKGRASY